MRKKNGKFNLYYLVVIEAQEGKGKPRIIPQLEEIDEEEVRNIYEAAIN